MKIANIETFLLKVALGSARFYSSQCAFPDRSSLLVKITTDSGICGWGECGQYGPGEPISAAINHVLAPVIMNQFVQPNVLWEKMYAATRDFGQKGTYIEAISGIDIALWDILGKEYKRPICEIIGGKNRDAVTAYATGCYYRGEDYLNPQKNFSLLEDEARSFVDNGFSIVKMKIGLLSCTDDLKRVEVVRQTIGNNVKLLIDCNHSYNYFTVKKMCQFLKDYDIGWLEEPVVPEDKKSYALLRQNSAVPIAGGECEYTRYGYQDFLEQGCVDIAQPDICVCGGLSEVQKINVLTTVHGVMNIPHVWGSAVALAAALQYVATLPAFPHTAMPVALQNEPIIEYDQNPNPLRDELCNENFILEHNRVAVPQKPGLGITINEEVLDTYCVAHSEV